MMFGKDAPLNFAPQKSNNMRQHLTILALSILFSTHAARAQTWVQQHPNHSLKDLYDVSFNNLGTGIAVGGGKSVLTTTDWGNTWTPQVFSQSSTTFHKVKFAPEPGSQVAYLLENSRVFKTMDAGMTWTQLSLMIGTLGSTKAIEVLSENEVFVLGSTNILHTVNGGSSWTAIDKPNSTISIKSFQFLTPELGWIGAGNGDIFGTTNGGATWEALDTTQFDKAVVLRFFDANIGYAGTDLTLAKTIDGGHTWISLDDQAFSTAISTVAFVNATNVCFTQGNRVYYTKDGGTTLQYKQPLNYSGPIRGIFALPDGRIWTASDYHSIAYSTDGGEQYQEQIPGTKNLLGYIGLVDENHGWATGFYFTILKTSDGGNSWQDLSPVPTPSNMWIVRNGLAVSADEFWICGNSFISKTTDGGLNWLTVHQGGGSINCLEATSNAVYSAHSNGRVYKTTNEGDSWTYGDVQSQATLVSLSFPSDNVGYVVGWNGLLAKTTDAGATWTVLDFPTMDNLGEVYFLDENTGWIGLDRFSTDIYQTTDGGQTWMPITMPNSAYWYNIHFQNPQKAFVSGGSSGIGRVYRTSDGGETWISIYGDEQTPRGMSVLSTPTKDLLWICGNGGSISHTTIPLFSTILSAPEMKTLEFFPNPSKTTIRLSHADQFSPEAVLEILDLHGSIVLQKTGIPDNISLGAVPSGLYVVRVRDGATLYAGKLTVE